MDRLLRESKRCVRACVSDLINFRRLRLCASPGLIWDLYVLHVGRSLSAQSRIPFTDARTAHSTAHVGEIKLRYTLWYTSSSSVSDDREIRCSAPGSLHVYKNARRRSPSAE